MGDSKDLEKIKKEGAEDASSYYAQGDKGEEHDLKGEYNKSLPPVDSATEEFNLVRTLSYLAFGGAALALVFILFFINKKVDGVGKELGELAPFKKEVGEHIVKLVGDLDKLKGRVEQNEKSTMVMELKRALVTVEGVTADSSPEIKAKSAQAVAGIQSLLDELGAGSKAAPTVPVTPETKPGDAVAPPATPPASEVKPADAAAPATPPASEVKPTETPAPAATPPASEAKPADVAPAAPKASAKKASADDDDEEDD